MSGMKYAFITAAFLAVVGIIAAPLHFYQFKRPLRTFDLTFFGVAFGLSAFGELANILSTNWQYRPKFFGITTTGILAISILAAQPLLHLAIGYGFLMLRRWAFYLAVFYTADVLTSAVLGYVQDGFGRIRTLFLVFLTPFLIYLVVRRAQFTK
ncbi:MAG: hypothetical protein HY204_08625 [Nitrospirae bacterium]|nr:hypothetical protein [Nitrospirota bacterium]